MGPCNWQVSIKLGPAICMSGPAVPCVTITHFQSRTLVSKYFVFDQFVSKIENKINPRKKVLFFYFNNPLISYILLPSNDK